VFLSPKLRRELLGYAIALVVVVIVVHAIELTTSSLATLGIDWYWWLGFGLFVLPLVVWAGERRKKPSCRRQTIREEIDLAQARYEYVSQRDSYLEKRMLRRVA
jgi:hypothetical protein